MNPPKRLLPLTIRKAQGVVLPTCRRTAFCGRHLNKPETPNATFQSKIHAPPEFAGSIVPKWTLRVISSHCPRRVGSGAGQKRLRTAHGSKRRTVSQLKGTTLVVSVPATQPEVQHTVAYDPFQAIPGCREPETQLTALGFALSSDCRHAGKRLHPQASTQM